MSDSVRPHRRQPARLPVPGILQARTLEWVAISSSNAWKWKVRVKSLSWVRLLATPWTVAHQASPSMGFSRQEYWSGVPLTIRIVCTIELFKHLRYFSLYSSLHLTKFIIFYSAKLNTQYPKNRFPKCILNLPTKQHISPHFLSNEVPFVHVLIYYETKCLKKA